MPLKFKYTKKDEIPNGHESLYLERDGAWFLDAEGVVEKSKLDEFRNNNTALKKQFDDLAAKYKDLDPELARQLLQAKRDAEDKALLAQGNVDAVVEARTRALKADLENRLITADRQRAALETRLGELQINQAVVAVAGKRGLKPAAAADLVARAKSVFRLVNGQVAPVGPDGASVLYGRDGVNALTFDEWVETQVAEAPHLFAENSGGGAAGSSGGAGQHSGKNPFKKGADFNLTEQMRIAKNDPQMADRLRAAA